MNPWHRTALLALCALAVLQVAWYGWWAPVTGMSKAAAISFALVWFALPLLAARQDSGRGLLVGALVALLYFSHGVMEAFANPDVRLPALLEIFLSLVVVACAGWPSWQRAAAKKRQREQNPSD
jgi:uncharacterized membrane protein